MWPPESETVRAAMDGDRAAFSAILSEGHPRLIAFLIGVGLRRTDADEVAAETAESVVKSLGRLRAPEAFEAWFWSIARNRLRSFYRRRSRREPTDALVSPSTPEELWVVRDEHLRILAALHQLSPRDRELIWLRVVEGLEYEEISGRFGSSEGTVRVAIHRAKKRLEEIYRQDEGRP